MRDILALARKRFTIIAGIIGEVQGLVIVMLFYFTILVPFGIGSRIFSDPLYRRGAPIWHQRPEVPNDIDSARQQG